MVAENDGRIVGVVQTVFNTVNALYVEADSGSGIGSQLLSAAEAALRGKGVNAYAFVSLTGFHASSPSTNGVAGGWRERLSTTSRMNQSGAFGCSKCRRRWRPLTTPAQRLLMIVKAVLCVAAIPVILLSFELTGALGMTKGASVAVGGMLALIVGRFVLGLRSPHFGVGRTLILGAAGTCIYLLVPLAAITLGWLGLQAAGLQEQAARDRTMTSILVLSALVILAERPARYAVARVWEQRLKPATGRAATM
jgi:hypothetical protein